MLSVALLLPLLGPSIAQPRATGLPIAVESLGLRFDTPEGWRLDSAESGPTELLLLPGKTKTLPLLRVRTFYGNFSASDRLAQMVKGLSEEEQGVVLESVESWELDGRHFETVTAIHHKGVQEWQARFTLVDQPKKLQHAFWLFGREQDLERQWQAISASIASARFFEPADGEGSGSSGEETEEAPPEVTESFVWQDVKSGLRVASWPTGFEPDEASLSRLSMTGVVLRPSDEEAPQLTEINLSRHNVSPMVTEETATDTLEEKVQGLQGVSELRRIRVRVAGQPAMLLRWRQQPVDGDSRVYQVYLFKRESALFRIDYTALESWANVRARRDLLKQFVASLSFR